MSSMLLIPEMQQLMIIMSMQLKSLILSNLKWALFYWNEIVLEVFSMFVIFSWLQIFHVNNFLNYIGIFKLKLMCMKIILMLFFEIKPIYWVSILKNWSLHVFIKLNNVVRVTNTISDCGFTLSTLTTFDLL